MKEKSHSSEIYVVEASVVVAGVEVVLVGVEFEKFSLLEGLFAGGVDSSSDFVSPLRLCHRCQEVCGVVGLDLVVLWD